MPKKKSGHKAPKLTLKEKKKIQREKNGIVAGKAPAR
jgi:hypothetical protein